MKDTSPIDVGAIVLDRAVRGNPGWNTLGRHVASYHLTSLSSPAGTKYPVPGRLVRGIHVDSLNGRWAMAETSSERPFLHRRQV